MNTAHARRRLAAFVAVLLFLPAIPAVAQSGGGGGGGGGGGSGGLYAELVVALRDANGVPEFIEVAGETEGEFEYCVQPVTTEAVPDPYHLLGDAEAPEFLPTVVNEVDGREVTVVPLFAHYPEFLPEEDAEVHALAPPDDHDDEEGGEPCDPLVLVDEGGAVIHDYNTYVSEVELERLNLARAPETVLARHLIELQALLEGTPPDLVTLDVAGRITFDGVAIDAMPKLQGMREQLIEAGTLPGAGAYPVPFQLVADGHDRWSMMELSAFALGGAASKFGSIDVDVVAYHDRIMGLAADWLAAAPAQWPPQVHEYAPTGELFVDYGDFEYSRADTFRGCVTYLDPADWRSGYKVEPLLEAVEFPSTWPKTDGLAGYAQMAEDARAVILFVHEYDAVIDFADSPGLETCAAQEVRRDELNAEGPTDPTDPTDPTSPWSDLSVSNVHFADIVALADDGIVLGYPDGTYRPFAPVTRGQVASVLARTIGLPGLTPPTPTYSDIDGSVHEANIEALAAAGLIVGYADGTFRPGEPIRRDQTASVIGRWLEVELVADGPFTDVSPASVHAPYINGLYEAGVIRGTSETTFAPAKDVQRDQFAALVNRAR
jgi:hypothetical protein